MLTCVAFASGLPLLNFAALLPAASLLLRLALGSLALSLGEQKRRESACRVLRLSSRIWTTGA
jgi:hypothetical protein